MKVAEVADGAEVGSLVADDGQEGEIALTGGDPAIGEDADAVAIDLDCPINSGRYNPKTADLRAIAGCWLSRRPRSPRSESKGLDTNPAGRENVRGELPHISTTIGRVAPGDYSPRAPKDPYVPSRAYGSSRHELAAGRYTEWIATGGGNGYRPSSR